MWCYSTCFSFFNKDALTQATVVSSCFNVLRFIGCKHVLVILHQRSVVRSLMAEKFTKHPLATRNNTKLGAEQQPFRRDVVNYGCFEGGGAVCLRS